MKFGITQKFTCSYLPEEEEQLLVCMLPSEALKTAYPELVNLGFRRSGEQLYRPHCGNCKACESLRIMCNEFSFSKSQKRVQSKNKSLTVSMRFDERDDYYPLYEAYIEANHKDGSMYPANYEQYSSFIRCQWQKPLFVEARDEHQLVAVAVTDKLKDGLSALYTFYHPDYSHRSLGSFMILEQIKATLSLGLDYLYLGYQIDDCKKMNYKQKFRPHQRFINNQWVIYR
ncbi:arginyltransferase [Glaciecola sp. 1036]|uniref:arginyltransferase n=1 Tax=Alteromonadaceae TaxID=72275 RepID=UPI003CFF813D